MLRMKVRAPTARQVRFVLCEDARQEVSGKATLVGVYPGEIIVVHQPTSPEGSNAVAALRSVCMVFFVAGGVGRFDAGIKVCAPDGTVSFEQKVGTIVLEPGGTGTIIGQIQPFFVKEFGAHTVVLTLEGREYPFEMTIRKAVPAAIPATIN